MSVEGYCIDKLMNDAREEGFKLGRESLESENKRLREALAFLMQTLKNDAIEGYDQKADEVYKSALEGK